METTLATPKKIAIVGLGYVGLPLAVAFGKQIPTLGYDISSRRIALLKSGEDSNGEIHLRAENPQHLTFTDVPADLRGRDVYIVTVPTPVDQANHPQLSHLVEASKLVGAHMAKGAMVVYESTVYPGCTEEVCLPVLEQVSGLKAGQDFFLGYSPERINPGDTEHTLETIYKIVAAQTAEKTDVLAELYGLLNEGKIFKAANIKTAEAAKVIENTQRDLNIALMNELSMLFHRLGINTREVLAASRTKWNFLPFEPGLVGGHCIPVDPYYLTHKAVQVGYHPEVILAGRRINDQMSSYVAHEIVRLMAQSGMNPREGQVLMLGVTFKENVRDMRNSLALKLIEELGGYSVPVVVHDPVAEMAELQRRNVALCEDPFASGQRFRAIILAVGHRQFRHRTTEDFLSLLDRSGTALVFDLKGLIENSAQMPEGVQLWQL